MLLMKLTTTAKNLSEAPKKYCRLIITEDAPNWHRLVETTDGHLEYRMGAGKWKQMTPRKFRLFLRSIVQAAKGHQIEHLAVQLSNSPFPKLNELGDAWVLSTIAENFLLAAYEFSTYKTKKEGEKGLKEILVCGGMTKSEKTAFDRGTIVATYTNLTRDIANTPGDDMTPSKLAAASKAAAAGTKVKVTIFDKAKIKQQKMGLLEAVGKGASDGPKFIVMEYFGSAKHDQPVILIGKGITYDTGGLNIKPTGAMHDMHLDMSGGAAVIGAICAVAKLGLKKNVVALVPAAENAISDRAMRAGDIVTSMSGKTVEVLHTDAEGRLVLADALTYAQTYYKPKVMIDCATLTGAALVALGQQASAVMSKDDAFAETLKQLGEETGDLVWPLPLWSEYEQQMKGQKADLKNVVSPTDKMGGSITAAAFLSHFVEKKLKWAHIDIAPRMESIPTDKLSKGATGEPVRLLVKFIETQ